MASVAAVNSSIGGVGAQHHHHQQQQLPPLPPGSERHTLNPEEELRLEVRFQKHSTCTILLQAGSCELQGVELSLQKAITLYDGGYKLALFTWHGCVLDINCEHVEISYTSDETQCNVAYVNTHAQLEAMRDEAAAANMKNAAAAETGTTPLSSTQTVATDATADNAPTTPASGQGPRVLIVGPKESGKSSFAKLLTAYAVKLGRTPLWVDLDPADNALSVPGTLAAWCPTSRDVITVESFASTGIPISSTAIQGPSAGGGGATGGSSAATAAATPHTPAPLVLWHGGAKLSPDLFKAQVTAMGRKIDRRLQHDEWTRSSGVIVNTNGWIQDEGFDLLLHSVSALKINIVLVMGHDRLYSMLKSSVNNNNGVAASGGSTTTATTATKVIKVPRSGGVVSRASPFLRQCRARSLRRYFYGDLVETNNNSMMSGSAQQLNQHQSSSVGGGGSGSGNNNDPSQRVAQFTPFLLQLPFSKITLYKFSSMNLSASLLPVASMQATEPVQLVQVDWTTSSSMTTDSTCHDGGGGGASNPSSSSSSSSLEHAILAVCHPTAVAAYENSGRAKDLYESGVAGFCAVERIGHDTETVHLLCPSAGQLPSYTLLLGDVTWME